MAESLEQRLVSLRARANSAKSAADRQRGAAEASKQVLVAAMAQCRALGATGDTLKELVASAKLRVAELGEMAMQEMDAMERLLSQYDQAMAADGGMD